MILSDYSSTDEWPIVPPPPQSLAIPMSCSETEEDDSSSTGPEAILTGPEEEVNSSDALKPPSVPKGDGASQVSREESAVGNVCYHRDSAGKRCCNLALECKRLCKCHYSDTLKLQEALGLLVSSPAVQETSESGRSTPQEGKVNIRALETEPVSPVSESSPTEEHPPTLVKEEPPSPTKADPPQVCVKVEPLQVSVKVESAQEVKAAEEILPAPSAPVEAIQSAEVQIEARDKSCLTPMEVTLQNASESSDNEGQSSDQMDASFYELDPAATIFRGELRVVPEPTGEEDKSAALSPAVSELDKLNVKEQGLVCVCTPVVCCVALLMVRRLLCSPADGPPCVPSQGEVSQGEGVSCAAARHREYEAGHTTGNSTGSLEHSLPGAAVMALRRLTS